MILLEFPAALTNPLLWLAFSCFLLAIALTAVLMAALPTLLELARVSRSAEKLLDTLNRELPQTLEALRITGSELGELTDEVSEGIQSASRTVQRVDQSLSSVQKQAQTVGRATRSAFIGFKVAWKTFVNSPLAEAVADTDLPPKEAEGEDLEDETIRDAGEAIAPASNHSRLSPVPLPPLNKKKNNAADSENVNAEMER